MIMQTDAGAVAPLSGVRVLDFSQFLSGPYCSMILADMGAEVIKVEGPVGDLARHIPPHFVGDDSVYYLSINRNKRSACIDLKHPEGLGIAQRLCAASDVVLENFRPGVLERLGLGATSQRAARPQLIWCSISGFGQDGPCRDKPAYDMLVQAVSGGMSLTGEPAGAAVRAGIPIADLAAGMYAAIAILGALRSRQLCGLGDYIDISMLDCQVAMLCYQAAYNLHSGLVPGRQGSSHDSIPTYRSFVAQDGVAVVVTANTERMWQGLCSALGVSELISQPRFATNRERYENRAQLAPLLEEAFLKRPASEWIELLEAHEVPVGVVNTLDRVMTDPQVQHRHMVEELAAADGRRARVMASPIKFTRGADVLTQYPPALGEQTGDILADMLGMSAQEIACAAEGGAIRLCGSPRR
jgi:crotonobetainyl-CoA:carnitine CoA-transferase CaiB-like acyl-CoA transferase